MIISDRSDFRRQLLLGLVFAGKWSAGKADCILGAKDYATAKQCE